jgi:ATP-dependent protease Clp ATPase subunit
MSDQPFLFCTFCSRPQTDVAILVAAPGGSAAICDDCLDLAVDVVRMTKEDRAAVAAGAAEEAAWLKREANPEWQKGLHKFVEPNDDTNRSDL